MKVKDVIELRDLASLKGDYITIPADYSFVTPYIMVYGTLRVGQGNYIAFDLGKHTTHIGTYCLPGWQLSGISATPTGDRDDVLIVDLLELKPSRKSSGKERMHVYELNYRLDGLESVHSNGYLQTLVPLNMTRGRGKSARKVLVWAKLYQGSSIAGRGIRNPNGDYIRKDEAEPSTELYDSITLAGAPPAEEDRLELTQG